jgi:hypothetical protein
VQAVTTAAHVMVRAILGRILKGLLTATDKSSSDNHFSLGSKMPACLGLIRMSICFESLVFIVPLIF